MPTSARLQALLVPPVGATLAVARPLHLLLPSVGAGVLDGPPAPTRKPFVGRGALTPPPALRRTLPAGRTPPAPQNILCRAGPVCPAAHRTPCNVSLRASAHTDCGDPHLRPQFFCFRFPRPLAKNGPWIAKLSRGRFYPIHRRSRYTGHFWYSSP